MYTIQANTSGTRSIEVSDEHLATIQKYGLFQVEDSKDLLDLCIDVIYHNNMKAFGLQQLIRLYLQWLPEHATEEEEEQS